jgi:gamma-glutamyl-gamma-aminobutyrate hydrolase PuuD
MKTKLIGIVGWATGENSFGCSKAYINFLSRYGKVIILAPTSDVIDGLDLLVLPGGADMSSHIYGEVPFMWNTSPDLFKEFFYTNNLSKYIELNIPIFGICLGMQQIGVHFGAKLDQNITNHPYSNESRQECVHKIMILKSSTVEHIIGVNNFKVNSLHHQVINYKSIPNCIELVGVSDKDFSIEIIKHKTKPIWGVQYHPEEIFDKASHNIIKKLLNIN